MRKFLSEHHFTTRACLEGLLDSSRAGLGARLDMVRGGHLYRPCPDDPHRMVTMTAVIVSGVRGDVLFTGFSWGYGGTGPHGLCTLFHFLGMDQKAAMEDSMAR